MTPEYATKHLKNGIKVRLLRIRSTYNPHPNPGIQEFKEGDIVTINGGDYTYAWNISNESFIGYCRFTNGSRACFAPLVDVEIVYDQQLHPCTCDMVTLLRSGCACGSVLKYEEPEL